jgi:hypothetical protein
MSSISKGRCWKFRDGCGDTFSDGSSALATTRAYDDFPVLGDICSEFTEEGFPRITLFEFADLVFAVSEGAEEFAATFAFCDEFDFRGVQVFDGGVCGDSLCNGSTCD